MIKYSYLKDQIEKAKKELGKGNVVQLKKYILLKDIEIPKKFGSEKGVLCLEIPEGYGYGAEIMVVHILLDKNKVKNHFHEINWEGMPVEVQNEFHLGNRLLTSWYWICFHIDSQNSIQNEHNETVPLREFPRLIYIVLKAIADEDPVMMKSLNEMNLGRDEFLKEYRKLMNQITLENNWKKLSWMYV
jgi:hypothetical protein